MKKIIFTDTLKLFNLILLVSFPIVFLSSCGKEKIKKTDAEASTVLVEKLNSLKKSPSNDVHGLLGELNLLRGDVPDKAVRQVEFLLNNIFINPRIQESEKSNYSLEIDSIYHEVDLNNFARVSSLEKENLLQSVITDVNAIANDHSGRPLIADLQIIDDIEENSIRVLTTTVTLLGGIIPNIEGPCQYQTVYNHNTGADKMSQSLVHCLPYFDYFYMSDIEIFIFSPRVEKGERIYDNYYTDKWLPHYINQPNHDYLSNEMERRFNGIGWEMIFEEGPYHTNGKQKVPYPQAWAYMLEDSSLQYWTNVWHRSGLDQNDNRHDWWNMSMLYYNAAPPSEIIDLLGEGDD